MFKNKNFLIIAIGQLMSQFGNTLQRIALSLYILDITGSAKIFSIILALSMIPQIILAPLGGAIADRFDKKKIMVGLDFVSGLILTVFTILVSNGNASVIAIGVLVFLLQIIESIYDPNARASIVNIVEKKDLEKANSIMTTIGAISMLLGPVLAGVLYGLCGIKIIFIINVITFITSAIMECFLKIPYKKEVFNKSIIKVFGEDIKESSKFLIKGNKVLLAMTIIGTTVNLFLTPIYSIGVPYVEKQIFGVSSTLYGISEGVVGISMIVGAILTGIISKKIPIKKLDKYFYILAIAEIIMSIACLPTIIALGSPSYVAYIIFTISGFLFGMIITMLNILTNTYIQTNTPKNMIGKITALITVLSLVFMSAGQGIFGILYETFSNNLLVINGSVTILTIITGIITAICLKRYYVEDNNKDNINNNEENINSNVEAEIL